jgi:hypothetical protein
MDVYQANVQLVGRIASINRANGNTVGPRTLLPQSSPSFTHLHTDDTSYTKILPKDRADMERYYLKLCTKDAASEEDIVKLHPRYLQLCDSKSIKKGTMGGKLEQMDNKWSNNF